MLSTVALLPHDPENNLLKLDSLVDACIRTSTPRLSNDNQNSVVVTRSYVHDVRCVVLSKTFQYNAADSNSKHPDSNETHAHPTQLSTCLKYDVFRNAAPIPETQFYECNRNRPCIQLNS
jgi:hypothetical protein